MSVINLLIRIRLSLIKENETFKICGTLALKSETVNELYYRILCNVSLAVNREFQMGVARKPSLLCEETEAKRWNRLL